MMRLFLLCFLSVLALVSRAGPEVSQEYDAALAEQLGADAYGMRPYVLAILVNGPTPLAAGPERDAMFAGHFANMKRLAEAGRLVLAGPLDGDRERRGIFILATDDLDEARAWVETDPVVQQGEMQVELHRYYGSAALPLLRDIHERIAKEQP